MSGKQAQIQRGFEARSLLENPLLQEAMDKIIATYENAWRNSPVGAIQERERLYLMRAAAVDFKAHLTQVLTTGDFALAEIDRQDQAAGKVRELA